MEVWRSEYQGIPALVKMWKPGTWGDLRREAPRILACLETATSLKADRPEGLAPVHAAHWLGDAVVLVQGYIEGSTLAALIADGSGFGETPNEALGFLRTLFATVERLHESDYAHGDLKPDNIVIAADGRPTLIDPIDFAAGVDGEISTTAYAPASGNSSSGIVSHC